MNSLICGTMRSFKRQILSYGSYGIEIAARKDLRSFAFLLLLMAEDAKGFLMIAVYCEEKGED